MLVEFSYKSYFITTATQITAKAFAYMVIGTPSFKSSSRENFFCEQMFCHKSFWSKLQLIILLRLLLLESSINTLH